MNEDGSCQTQSVTFLLVMTLRLTVDTVLIIHSCSSKVDRMVGKENKVQNRPLHDYKDLYVRTTPTSLPMPENIIMRLGLFSIP